MYYVVRKVSYVEIIVEWFANGPALSSTSGTNKGTIPYINHKFVISNPL